eukprot:CAMPEP_0116055724 /NCGR_PEP_ID=MMETSP0322-20121206/3579_1 /TAXON_ID=163516 /ORGANISM="Leptocylindrus danicus var. apora, Strain B651" /LENGTH=348 /DNA_ID=CAMNT_0003539385 /DNA_START=363 /DNA_END=1409 /DNA_ORIENTATION=-
MAIIKEKHLKNLDQDGEKINDEVVDKNRIDAHILGREELGDESFVNDLNDGVVRAPQHHFDAAKVANEISMNTSLDDLWKNKFHRLVKFYKTVGYQRSEIEIVRKDQNLKLWIDRQRIQYQKEMRRRDRLKEVGDDINDNPPIMPQEKIDLLNGIHFHWGSNDGKYVKRAKWQDMFYQLEKFKEQNGHCNPKSPKALHAWVRNQRSLLTEVKKKKSLRSKTFSIDKILLLDGLGFDWGKHGDVAKQLRKERNVRLNVGDLGTGKRTPSSKQKATHAMKNKGDAVINKKETDSTIAKDAHARRGVVVIYNKKKGIDCKDKAANHAASSITFRRNGVSVYYGPVPGVSSN